MSVNLDIVVDTLLAALKLVRNKLDGANKRMEYHVEQTLHEGGLVSEYLVEQHMLEEAIVAAGGAIPKDEPDGEETTQLQA